MEGSSSRNDEDPSQSNRSSYYDIYQEQESETAYRDLLSSKSGNNKSRKSFNDRLRLSRSSSKLSASSRPVPTSDITFGSHRFQPSTEYPGDDYVVDRQGDFCERRPKFESSSQRHSGRVVVVEDPAEDDAPKRPITGGRFLRSSSVAVTRAPEEDEEEDEEEEEEEDEEKRILREGEAEPAKVMSLMDLLEETDRQAGVVGATYYSYGMTGEEEEEEAEEEDDEEEEEGEGVVERVCCVCMVRHKGAAFIPCGHTFCRLCSRELWVSRGNCPLCNGYIMEILDIF